MADDLDLPLERDELTRPIHHESKHGGSPSKPPWLGVAAVVVVLAFAVAWLVRHQPRSAPAVAPPAGPEATTAPAEPVAESAQRLPALGASDAFVRELAAGLSSSPGLASWLAGEGLVRRYVTAVQNVAEGASPARQLPALRPEGRFATLGEGARSLVDPASFRRYDQVAEVFASLDATGVAELHRRIEPLLDQAYREVGDPTVDFRHQLARAIRRLLSVPVPRAPVAVVADGLHWRWADPDLETRAEAEKHLLRMGPENQVRVQEKLEELRSTLALDAD